MALERSEPELPLLKILPWWLLVAGLLLAAGLLMPVYEPFAWLLLALGGIAGLGLCLGSAWLCCQLMVLGLFTGVLSSVPVGFTFKSPQLFALLGLLAWGLARLRGIGRAGFPWHWALPFCAFLVTMLPSFWMVDRGGLGLGEGDSSLRLLLNYSLLQLFALLLLLETDSFERVLNLLRLAWISCLASLLFGFGQQIGFYLGIYDPFAWVGRHSSIIDFYGPFLRLAPGTFANEYGEILQTVGLLLTGWIFLVPRGPELSAVAASVPGQTASRPRRWGATLLLFGVMLGLVINFTRASWLVYAAGSFVLLVAARLRLRALLGLSLLGGLALSLLLWLSQVVLAASVLLSVGQRFGELSQLRSSSAGQRLQTWQLAWEAFTSSPWIGNGWGRFAETHNVPLQLLAETGILGFLGFYGLMAWCLLTMYRAWSRPQPGQDPRLRPLLLSFMIALLGCLAFDLTNHGLYHFVLWFCVAMGLALARLASAERLAADPVQG